MEARQDTALLEQLNAQIEYLSQLMQQLDSNLENISEIKRGLEEFSKVKGDEDVMAPIASGIFVDAKLKTNKHVKINVGRGVVVKKTIPEAVELLEKQEAEINNARKEALKKMEELYAFAAQQNFVE